MSSIIRHTIYGDTMFVCNPVKAAEAIAVWAVAQGHYPCVMENLDHGCIRITIHGLTHITLAPKEKDHELLCRYC